MQQHLKQNRREGKQVEIHASDSSRLQRVQPSWRTGGYWWENERGGQKEEGCNWCVACKGMPVTPPAAKHDLPPTPNLGPDQQAGRPCVTNLHIVSVCVRVRP